MKKLITTAAFLMFGTMFISAQTTKKNSTTTMPDKPANSTEMKLKTPVESNSMNRTADTATSNNASKLQNNQKKIQTPKSTMPQNSTTMPENSTATPQVQPVSPVDAKPAQ